MVRKFNEDDERLRDTGPQLLEVMRFRNAVEDVARHAEALFAAGATRVEFGTRHGVTDRHGVELLGRAVLPAPRGER
ncbi:hypothetical protein [Amycolatopsis taiwanensis]|uniref:Uncharacterized protein n=1 Tax=Amycolatopsis taiwanensis TaxID=342230 RepID=A0A9W6VJ37_9PSEU|nr:hypothetical protein [Amycolatopsis taiwanensis]GLY69114.1 hypothetical protein Atai01_57330 [Amycolatopsis taiwanensis]